MTRTVRERGSVTAELAVVLPAVVLVALLGIWSLTAVAVHVRCLDAARSGARALARGEPATAVVAVAHEAAPAGASVRTRAVDGGLAAVEVQVRVAMPGPWGRDGPGLTVGGRVVAQLEGTGW